jgi:protein ImuB
MDYVLRFPVPMLEVKTFLRLLQLELQAKPPGAPVGKIVLSAEPVAPRFLQGGLFLPVSPEPQKLEVMLARIRNLVSRGAAPGKTPAGTTVTRGAEDKADGNNPEPENVYAGAAELLDTHRPDAFRMRRFPPQQARDGLAGDPAAARGQMGAPAKEPEQKTGNGNAHDTPAGKAGDFSTPSVLRRFRPPQPVKVQVEDGRPKTISYSPLLPGKRGTGAGRATVSWAAGPWRESGEWWTAQPWSREVWDVAVQQEGGAGIYRLYHDAIGDQWFIEAEYD